MQHPEGTGRCSGRTGLRHSYKAFYIDAAAVIVDRRSEMIRRPTVLILGAGASAEYEFPVGRSLLLQIVHELRGPSPFQFVMKACGFSDELIKQFCRELSDSNQPSVDAFLEQHKDNTDYERLGKPPSLDL
jgi:hypothetical protein